MYELGTCWLAVDLKIVFFLNFVSIVHEQPEIKNFRRKKVDDLTLVTHPHFFLS